MPDFHSSVSVVVSRCRCRTVLRKNRVRTGRLCRCCWGLCAVIARQALDAGRRVSRAIEWTELQGVGTADTENRTRSYMNGWTATANLRKRRTLFLLTLFLLRKLRSSYGILTDERNYYVLLQRTAAIRERRNCYVMMETTHQSQSWLKRAYVVSAITLYMTFTLSARASPLGRLGWPTFP